LPLEKRRIFNGHYQVQIGAWDPIDIIPQRRFSLSGPPTIDDASDGQF
jgi:hypothetical protein